MIPSGRIKLCRQCQDPTTGTPDSRITGILLAYVPFCKAVFTHCTLFLFVKWQSPFVHLCKVAFTHYTCPSLQSHVHPLPMHTPIAHTPICKVEFNLCTGTSLQSGIHTSHIHMEEVNANFAKRCMYKTY
jgi:hypothetical protein